MKVSEDMAIKLIALDLDGTLLTSKKTIDEETKKRLLEVQKKNGNQYCDSDRT